MYKTVEEVREAFKRGENLKYVFFFGHTPSKDSVINISCLSQWWISSFKVDEKEYFSMEQYMMVKKAMLFKDEKTLDEILKNRDPKTIKALGRKVKNFDEEIWKANRFNIVKEGNIAKFSQNDELKNFLISTNKKILVEASPFDRIWGIGMGKDSENIENPLMWRGENLLGFALMEAREIISCK